MLLRARYVLPVAAPPIEGGAVVVRAGRILDVGPHARVASRHPAERLHDLGEAVLFPGFVNAHSHLELSILRGFADDLPFFPWLRRLVETKSDGLKTEESVYYALLGAAEMIRAGITTVADCTDSGAPFDALAIAGLRGIVFQEAFAPAEPMVGAAISSLELKLDALQAMATDRVQPGVSPHSTYMACGAMLEAALSVAARRGLPASIHAAESAAESAFVRDGSGVIAEHFASRGWPVAPADVSPVAWLERHGWLSSARVQLVHVVHADEDDLGLLARARACTGLAACPRSNAQLGNGLPDLSSWTAHGLSWGLGTDGAPSAGRCDLFAEMRFASLAERGRLRDATRLGAAELVRHATLEAARSLGLQDLIGSIEPGKQADLAAIRLGASHVSPGQDPHALVAHLSSPEDVVLTMVGGDVLYDGQDLKTLDEPRVVERCRERAELLRRVRGGR